MQSDPAGQQQQEHEISTGRERACTCIALLPHAVLSSTVMPSACAHVQSALGCAFPPVLLTASHTPPDVLIAPETSDTTSLMMIQCS